MKGKAAVATCTARGRKLRSWSSEQGATVKREGKSFPHAAQHNMIEEIHCAGCGVAIQTEDTKAPGYAPKSALDREMVICQRCFKLKHYNQIQDVSLSDDDFVKILDGIGQKDALVVKIVDIFDFNGSWLPGLHRFVGKNDVLLVGNKADLLPKSLNPNRLMNWMRQASKELGLRPVDVHLISAKKGHGVDELAEKIDYYRKGRDVYVVGCTNVGKSTLINQVIKRFGEEDEAVITVSHFPGTTLDLIDIPLDDNCNLYDTPGIINHHQMAHYVDAKDLKLITPKKEIKPQVFQIHPQQTLFFGGLARLDYMEGNKRSFVIYMSNELKVHRTKLEKADDLYANHNGELLSPPNEKTREMLPPLVRHEFSLRDNMKTDIVFSGLGWVAVHGKGGRVAAYAPKGVAVSLREALV